MKPIMRPPAVPFLRCEEELETIELDPELPSPAPLFQHYRRTESPMLTIGPAFVVCVAVWAFVLYLSIPTLSLVAW